MDLTQLNDHFAIPGVLRFDQHNELTRANVTTPAAQATVYLQGAHLTHWQPAGFERVLFLSRKSDFVQGKPIRGGVPIAFPWFATDSNPNRYQGKPGPSHGFARTQDWTVANAALAGKNLHITFTLGPTELSRQMGFDHFKLAFELIIGSSLTMRLTVANDSSQPLHFEEAMHTYYEVVDVHEASVTGLEPTSFIDKTDNFRVKPPAHAPIAFTTFTDRVYENTAATCVITDVPGKREITVAKTNSNTTVVFNPWKELPDMGPDEWHEMLALETVNAASNAVTLEPGKTHTMQAHVTVEHTGK